MKKNLTMRNLPLTQRPREKTLQLGLENLTDSELLGILIGNGAPGYNAVDLANVLLSRFQDFRTMSLASAQELQEVKGIGPVKSLEIKACLELARRFQQITLTRGLELNKCRQVFACYHQKLRDAKKERFLSLLLDSKNRIIREELVSIGSLNISIVHPREVFAPAIRESAAGILLLHNHPSGDPQPSNEDILVTRRLVEVGKLVGIDVLDHIIIGDGCYVSFLEQNLPPFE